MMYAQTQSGYMIKIPFSFHGYSIINLINNGFFSVVVKVEDTKTHLQFAAKIISKKEMEIKRKKDLILNEINILRTVNHPNIIKVFDTFEIRNDFNEEYFVIIMEYCSNGDLFDYITQAGFRDEFEKKKISYNFLKAIEYLHNKGISHGDIKPENILLDENLNPKICDFGFSKVCTIQKDQNRNFTLCYAAPEMLKRGEINLIKSDIWAIGITLYCLEEASFPFPTGDDEFITGIITSGCLQIRTGEKLRSIVEKCTDIRPDRRPKIKDILENEYFSVFKKQYN